jgi:HPt (histidine-containing phosphotransfer) domain-containing protein
MTPDPEFEVIVQQFRRRTLGDGERLRLLLPDSVNRIEAMAEIRQLVHRLAGTAGTLGFSRLSNAAQAVEELFSDEAPDRTMLKNRLSAVLAAIAEANEPR